MPIGIHFWVRDLLLDFELPRVIFWSIVSLNVITSSRVIIIDISLQVNRRLNSMQISYFRIQTGMYTWFISKRLVCSFLSIITSNFLHFYHVRYASIKLGINMPARVEQTVRRSDCDSQLIGEPTGEFYDVIVFFGIIDILQDYDISKKLEHAYKSIQYDPTSISAVDPKQYSKRFRDFIYKIFTEDTWS